MNIVLYILFSIVGALGTVNFFRTPHYARYYGKVDKTDGFHCSLVELILIVALSFIPMVNVVGCVFWLWVPWNNRRRRQYERGGKLKPFWRSPTVFKAKER